ncbi:MAG: spermidine synthase [Rubrivivax sp.]|nr:spermidine synthase [Rubrivivax sp.]
MPTRRLPSRAELPPVTISEHEGVRYLHLGSIWVQGAMRIRKPQVVELVYVQRMLASLLWLPAQALEAGGHAVQLGLGAGAITRFTHAALGWRTTAVELNPLVIDAARLWFALPESAPGLALVRDDAMHWLSTQPPCSVQLLHVDLYDQDAAAPVLDDEAFYAACRHVLAPGGAMAVNLFGRHASFAASAARIAAAFGPAQVWSLQPTREGNTVVVATREVTVPDADTLRQRADTLDQRFGDHGLSARRWLRMVRPYVPAG